MKNMTTKPKCICCGDNLVEETGDWCLECLDNPTRIITK